MSTTRSPSPASRDGTPELMSPSAKIKALLATVDSSDDENSTTKPTADTMKISLSFERQASSPTQTQDETEDDEEEQVRPRGRLAARMHAAMNKTSEGNANQVLERANADEDDTIMTDGEDEDLPTAPRRLKRRALREATPTDTETSSRSASPGLFVSSPMRPSPTKSVQDTGSEADLPAPKSNRFTALVKRKKQERLAREAVEEAKREERRAQLEKLSSELAELDAETGNVSDITDDEGGRKLTQDVRPTRKASKRAIEEMNRETQRMARNMQLAHGAKTRKKISKNSLFERFNFRPAGEAVAEPKTASSSRPTTPIQSDVDMKDTETPPSSPPSSIKKAQHAKLTINDQPAQVQDISDGEMPTLDEIVASQKATLDKGKGKAVDIDLSDLPASKLKRHFRVRLPQPSVNLTLVDSDDELQITTTSKDRMKALFDSIPTTKPTEAKSLHALKALAQVRSPGRQARRKGEQTGMSMGALHMSLQQKARQQAKLERDRRMESLKAQGVVVQTAEEREKEMQEVEDIVAKAREEAEKIREAEKGEDEKNKDGSEKPSDPLAWDDSDDEEYQASGDEADAEASAVELSGSEDEEDAEHGEESGEDVSNLSNLMFDDAASDAESEAPKDQPSVDKDEDVNMDEEEEYAPAPVTRRARKHVTTVSDDEAEDEAEPVIEATPKSKSLSQATPRAPNTKSTTPGSVLRSAKKSFIPGFPVTGAAGIGLTQMFAGTMDDSQMSPGQAPTQSMMPDFDAFPDSNFSATMDDPPETNFTQGANTQAETQGIQLNYSQSQLRSMDSLLRDDIPATQYSEMIEPSQDGGFQEHTPLRERFMEPPHSTVATVVVDNSQVPESPLVRRGRLRCKMDANSAEDDIPPTASVSKMEASAFSAIKDGAEKAKTKKLQEAFDKKKSKAGEMVQEQADESEDEYAGLGGADGEDSDNESVGSIKELIDDVAGNDLDEGQLAAFYADRERANDEKQVEQLFKDITNGALRRKRGADYDLSDSDDGGEARRRMKRRQFAKMQKALFSDERVKKMAENPGNQAFLKTIEDRGSDDEMEFLDIVEEPSQEESQSQEASQQQLQQVEVVPDSQPARMTLGTVQENRAPASLRRTKGGRKPANLGEVRETLSSLLDEREPSIIPATAHGSDSEDDDRPTTARSDKENRAPNPRRTGVVVDRMSLKRNSSSNLSAASGRQAFTTHGSVSGSFKVPALLRRATTNSLLSTGPSTTTSSTNNKQSTGFGDDAKIKKVASKKSGVNAFARENERRGKMMESDRRRQEKKVRGAEKRAPAVKGLFGKGSFE